MCIRDRAAYDAAAHRRGQAEDYDAEHVHVPAHADKGSRDGEGRGAHYFEDEQYRFHQALPQGGVSMSTSLSGRCSAVSVSRWESE